MNCRLAKKIHRFSDMSGFYTDEQMLCAERIVRRRDARRAKFRAPFEWPEPVVKRAADGLRAYLNQTILHARGMGEA